MKPIGISSLLRPCDGFAGGQRHGCGRLAHLQQLHGANVHSCSRSSSQQASQAVIRCVRDQSAIQPAPQSMLSLGCAQSPGSLLSSLQIQA